MKSIAQNSQALSSASQQLSATSQQMSANAEETSAQASTVATVQIENGTPMLKTHQGPRENFCRPSVDVLFRSIAPVFKDRALAVVLTGMGQDGLRGCETLRSYGARIYVQNEATSVVWGMPGFVAK